MNVCRKEPHKINCTLRIKIYALLTIFPHHLSQMHYQLTSQKKIVRTQEICRKNSWCQK